MNNEDEKLKAQSIQRAQQTLDDEEGLPPLDLEMLEGTKPLAEADPYEREYVERAIELDNDDSALSLAASIPMQAVGAVRDAANAIKDLPIDIGSFAAKAVSDDSGDAFIQGQADKMKAASDLPEVEMSDNGPIMVGRKLLQFMVPFAGVSKLKLAKTVSKGGPAASAVINGVITDFTAFGSEEERLADVLQGLGYDNPLATDIDDSDLEKRLKTTLEGAGLGVAFDTVFKGIRASKQIVTGKRIAAEAAERVGQAKAGIKKVKEFLEAGNEVRLDDAADFRPDKETVSIATQRRLAEMVGTTADDINTGKAFEGLDLEDIRNRVNSFTLAEEKALFDMKTGVADNMLRLKNGDKSARADFLESLTDVLEINGKVLDQTADIARIQNFRKNADVLNVGAVRDAIARAKDGDIDRLMEAFAQARDSNELRALITNINKNADGIISGEKTLKDYVDTWFMNSILSSPVTLVSDTISNVVFTGYNKLVEKPVAAGIGGLRTMMGGTGDKVAIQESGVFLKSILDDAVESVRFIKRGFDEKGAAGIPGAVGQGLKQARVDNISRFGKHRPAGFLTQAQVDQFPPHLQGVAKFVSNTMTFPTQFMQTKDDVAKGLLYRSATRERATRRALYEGHKFGSESFNERVAQLVVSPIDNIADNLESLSGEAARQFDQVLKASGQDASTRLQIQRSAVKEARQLTFTDPASKLAEGVSMAADAVPGGRFIIPFVTTIDNLTRRAFERSPLALASPGFRDAIRKGGAEMDEAIARAVTGTVMMTAAYKLAVSGHVTGDGPTDRADKEALINGTGWRPRSFFVNGKYIDFSRQLGPLALMFQVPANMAELALASDNEMDAELQKTLTDKVALAAVGIGQTILSQSWARGLSELFDAVNSQDENAIERSLAFIGSSLVVPNAVTFVANELNPILQQVEGLSETVRSRAGVMVRPKRDLFGDPIARDRYLSVFSPAKMSDVRDVPAWKKELFNAGAFPPRPGRSITVRLGDRVVADGVKLNVEEYERLLELVGAGGVKDVIRNLVESPVWEALPNTKMQDGSDWSRGEESRRELVRRIYGEAVKAAEEALVAENPALFERAADKALSERARPDLSPLGQVIGELSAGVQ